MGYLYSNDSEHVLKELLVELRRMDALCFLNYNKFLLLTAARMPFIIDPTDS